MSDDLNRHFYTPTKADKKIYKDMSALWTCEMFVDVPLAYCPAA